MLTLTVRCLPTRHLLCKSSRRFLDSDAENKTFAPLRSLKPSGNPLAMEGHHSWPSPSWQSHAVTSLMIGHCEFHRLLLRRGVLRSITRGVAALPAKTHKGLSVRQLACCRGSHSASLVGRHLNRFRSHRLCAMSSAPQSAPPAAAAENGAHDDEVEALRRQVHELQVELTSGLSMSLIAPCMHCSATLIGHLAPMTCASVWPKSHS